MKLTTLERQANTVVTEMDYFTVNTALAAVPVTTGSDTTLYSNFVGARRWFEYNEGVLLKSIYVRLPYQFTWSKGPLCVSVQSLTSPATSAVFTEVGTVGLVNIPVENYELEINTFLNPPVAALATLSKWCLKAFLFDASAIVVPGVSMIGAPAILNAVQLPITVGVKIVHSFDITQNP